jgi:hypothetical protein
MLSNTSSGDVKFAYLLKYVAEVTSNLAGGESVHLLEKSFNLPEPKLITSIICFVIAKLYDDLVFLMECFKIIKFSDLINVQLGSAEAFNYVLRLIEILLFGLGISLIVYWGSPKLRLSLALIFVCLLLDGV